MCKAPDKEIAEVMNQEGYKMPPDITCEECKYFDKNCTYFPKKVWPMLWLTNQCPKAGKTASQSTV